MYTQTRKLILASAISLALASISGAALAGSPDQNVAEARQESQITTTYALSPYLRANELKVTVEDGTATLEGTVEEGVNKDLAEQIALGVNGIDDVVNRITVSADYAAPADDSGERSFGEVVDDATITAMVKSKLLWSKSNQGLEMNVDTHMGEVTLNGTAESPAARELAGRTASNTRGVTAVDNQLRVSATELADRDGDDGAEQHSTAQAFSDSWITTKVKSTFMYSNSVASNDISVSTDAGIVTLTGQVAGSAERDLATELAGNVRGVKSVNAVALTF